MFKLFIFDDNGQSCGVYSFPSWVEVVEEFEFLCQSPMFGQITIHENDKLVKQRWTN